MNFIKTPEEQIKERIDQFLDDFDTLDVDLRYVLSQKTCCCIASDLREFTLRNGKKARGCIDEMKSLVDDLEEICEALEECVENYSDSELPD